MAPPRDGRLHSRLLCDASLHELLLSFYQTEHDHAPLRVQRELVSRLRPGARPVSWATTSLVGESRGEDLRRALELSCLVHKGVAAKLVSNGRLLLQQSGFVWRDTAGERQQLGAIYDGYFMTVRARIRLREIAVQLLCCLDAVARDIVVNRFHPDETLSREELPDELRVAEVAALDRSSQRHA